MSDPHRPIYHFLPPDQWMNDPNGPIFYEGRHHLFYQYAPSVERGWGVKHWGHAVSDDLVHWEHLPIALSPSEGAGDQDGCYSGSAVLDDAGVPTILYTGVQPQVQCLARSYDGMMTWVKPPCNPVIAEPPAGIDQRNFRDPCLWREEDGWYMVIGSGAVGEGGKALLYRSQDLESWEYLHHLCEGVEAQTGTMWECPDFFALGDRHVLLVSTLGEQLYLIGDYDQATHRFEPRTEGRIGGGICFYAGKSYLDGAGRRILWGWLRERRHHDQGIAAGWSGAMSLPLVLRMLPNGSLGIESAPEVEAIRGELLHDGPLALTAGQHLSLDAVDGAALEIELEAEVTAPSALSLSLRRTPDGAQQTVVRLDAVAGVVELDMTRSSSGDGITREVHSRPLVLGDGEPLRLRAYVDRSVVEVFANARECLAGRVYPEREGATGVGLCAEGADTRVNSLRAWRMESVW